MLLLQKELDKLAEEEECDNTEEVVNQLKSTIYSSKSPEEEESSEEEEDQEKQDTKKIIIKIEGEGEGERERDDEEEEESRPELRKRASSSRLEPVKAIIHLDQAKSKSCTEIPLNSLKRLKLLSNFLNFNFF